MDALKTVALSTLGGLFAGSLIGFVEAGYLLSTLGAPDLLSPLYGVGLYGLICAGIGLGAGVVGVAIRKFWDFPDGIAWALGAIAATTPVGLFILRYISNKVIYAEAGVPLTGMLSLLAVIAVVDAVFVGLGFTILKGTTEEKVPRAAAVSLMGTGLLAIAGAIAAVIPWNADPRTEWAHNRPMPEEMKDKPNVLLIMVDTLRADYLGTYGAGKEASPALDELAADGVVFENAHAQASWTRASGASLMTSRLPSSHNADRKADMLPNDVVTWAEKLHDAGLTTGALINNINMTSTFNFDQGYDTFIYESPEYPFGATESVFSLTLYKVVHKLNEKLFGHHKEVVAFYQPADKVLADTQGFIKANEDSRWALFTHLMEPHDPYFEHPSVDGTGTDDYNGVGFARAEVEHPDSSPENIAYLKRVYAEEIVFMDRRLRTFFQWMKDTGVYDDTMIIITADHGEEFFEHGGWWHGTTLYDEQTHIPLIIKFPDSAHAGTRVPWTVRSIDIVPTIARELGLPVEETWEGKELVGDMASWLKAEEAKKNPPEPEPSEEEGSAEGELPTPTREVVENDPCEAYNTPFNRPVVSEEDFEGNVLHSLRKGGFRYSTANEGNPRGLPTEELFDIVADPNETADLMAVSSTICGVVPKELAPERAKELENVAEASKAASVEDESADMSAAEIQNLCALGYLSGEQCE